jgi:hypothetical protein
MAVQEVRVTIYRVTGKQLFFFKVNPASCRECDLMVNVVEKALDELSEVVRAKLEVKPWLNYFLFSIFRGGYHPPVLIVEGRVVSQAAVPTVEEVKRAVLQAWERKEEKKTSSTTRDLRKRQQR